MENVTTVIVSALVGGIVSYVGALWKNMLGERSRIDESLREARIDVYKTIWRLTGLLPQWPKSDDVTYKNLLRLSEDVRDWYFDKGGIYLSEEARTSYGNLQETLTHIVGTQASGKMSDEHYETARAKCSLLRSELTKDLLSRRRTLFG